MKLYKGKSTTEPIETLVFGEVQAGESKEYSFYIYNDNGTFLKNIEVYVDSSEVQVLEKPSTLDKGTFGLLKLAWKPSITLKKGLKTKIQLSGVEVWTEE
jgi:hypothetical protein